MWVPVSSFQVQQQKQQHPVRGSQGQQMSVPGQASISVPFYNNPMVFPQAHPIAVAAQGPTDSSERQPPADYSQDRSLRYPQPCWDHPGAVTENSSTWAARRAGVAGLGRWAGDATASVGMFPLQGEPSVQAGRVLCTSCCIIKGLKSSSQRISIN